MGIQKSKKSCNRSKRDIKESPGTGFMFNQSDIWILIPSMWGPPTTFPTFLYDSGGRSQPLLLLSLYLLFYLFLSSTVGFAQSYHVVGQTCEKRVIYKDNYRREGVKTDNTPRTAEKYIFSTELFVCRISQAAIS